MAAVAAVTILMATVVAVVALLAMVMAKGRRGHSPLRRLVQSDGNANFERQPMHELSLYSVRCLSRASSWP